MNPRGVYTSSRLDARAAAGKFSVRIRRVLQKVPNVYRTVEKEKCRLIMPDFSSRGATEIAVCLGGLSSTNNRPSKHGLGRYTSLSFSNRDSVGLVQFFSKPVRVELNRCPVCSVRLPCTCTLPRF